jgi:hypothetical protein
LNRTGHARHDVCIYVSWYHFIGVLIRYRFICVRITTYISVSS